MKFTDSQIKLAKEVRDTIIRDNIQELKAVYMAGEICMWDEIQQDKVNGVETGKDKCTLHDVNACLKSGWICEFNKHNIVCILRKDGELDEELTVARNLLTKEQNSMVRIGAIMRLDKQTGAVQFMLKDGINWR